MSHGVVFAIAAKKSQQERITLQAAELKAVDVSIGNNPPKSTQGMENPKPDCISNGKKSNKDVTIQTMIGGKITADAASRSATNGGTVSWLSEIGLSPTATGTTSPSTASM